MKPVLLSSKDFEVLESAAPNCSPAVSSHAYNDTPLKDDNITRKQMLRAFVFLATIGILSLVILLVTPASDGTSKGKPYIDQVVFEPSEASQSSANKQDCQYPLYAQHWFTPDPYLSLVFTHCPDTATYEAFRAAALKWNSIIAETPHPETYVWALPTPARLCPAGLSSNVQIFGSYSNVDRLVIIVEIVDFPDNALGRAGSCQLASSGLPGIGMMKFNRQELPKLNPEQFEGLILHEMGHVLGIGSTWSHLIWDPVGPDYPNVMADPLYIGQEGINELYALTGVPGNSVPVENAITVNGALDVELLQGSVNNHWRESVFKSELMTSRIDEFNNPLSRLTIAALKDLGYTVDYSKADAYAFPTMVTKTQRQDDKGIYIHDDIYVNQNYLKDSKAGEEGGNI